MTARTLLSAFVITGLLLLPGKGESQTLLINEIAASITNSNVDDFGEYEDWIEIYNPGKTDIDLGGWFFTDNLNRPSKWRIPKGFPRETIIHAGSFMILWPDKDTVQGPRHLGFALDRKGEELALFRPSGDSLLLVDSIRYEAMAADKSYGRCPEKKNTWMMLKHPTPGKANLCTPLKKSGTRPSIPGPPDEENWFDSNLPTPPVTTTTLRINEVICNNFKSKADENGEFDDWIEIYNYGTIPVNIAGWYVSDTTVASTFHRIPTFDPTKTTIPAGGYLILWADGQPVQGATHLPFKFDKDGEEFYLARMVNGTLEIIDQVVFPKAKNDVPYGRIPNGTGTFKRLSDATPLAANTAPRVLTGFLVNEIMAVNGPGVIDNYGEQEDWIELYNPTNSPINIGGLYLTDSTGDPLLSRIPTHVPDSTTIPAGGYLVLYADNDTWQGVRHLNFKLPSGGERILLTQPDGSTLFADIVYTYQAGDASFGRFPNGQTQFIFMPPTPGAANTYSFTPVNGIYVNEIMADNLSTYPDNLNENEDWIEFYNSNDFPVNLGGLYVSDSAEWPLNFRIPNTFPDSTTIPAKGFLTFWADNDPQQGVRHLDIKLSGMGEKISLYQFRTGATKIDEHTFGPQTENISIGRYPDGTAAWAIMETPTPGAPNKKLDVNRTTGVYINEFMARSTKTYPDETGAFSDWIELYNSNGFAVNLAGKYITNLLSQPGLYQLPSNSPAKTTIPAGGYLIFRADGLTNLGANHLSFTLKGSGDQIGLFENIAGTFFAIDSVTYGVQTDDISYGRATDGASTWKTFQTPTPNGSNGSGPSRITGLFINEIMARNTKTLLDDGGRYEDWIEIYNSTNQAIDLGGLYISDAKTEPLKHRISTEDPTKTRVPAKGYLLIWADLIRTAGPLHVNFELAGAGEPVLLTQVLEGQNYIIDSITYPILSADITYGRLGDGAPWWAWFKTPTPNAANSTVGLETAVTEATVHVFPNPFSEKCILEFQGIPNERVTLQVFNATGQVLAKQELDVSGNGKMTFELNADGAMNHPGIYFIRIQAGSLIKNLKVLRQE